MDLSKLSDADLLALKSGDISRVSDQGLMALRDGQRQQRVAAQMEKDRQTYDPTIGMSTFERTVAGYGSAVPRIIRGVRQYLPEAIGGMSPEQVAEANKLDEPLMNTTAGNVGNIAGNVMALAPTVAIPGAATMRGAAVIGAAQGLLTPEEKVADRLKNAGIGAGAGAGGVAAARALAGVAQGGKALVEPFYEGGRQKIAGRVIQRFANDPSTIASAKGTRSITGALPTLAEETGDAGLARLQDAMRSVDPQISNRIGQRLGDNNAARVAALQSLAGDGTQRAAASTARQAATEPLYQQAFAKTVEVDDSLRSLLSRPSVQSALSRAKSIAAEEGRNFGMAAATPGTPGVTLVDDAGRAIAELGGSAGTPAKVTGQTLQDVKMALDALLKDPTSGIAGKEAVNVKATRDAIVSWMEQSIPEFNAARTGYAALSKPLNAMDIGEEVSRRATSNTSDLAGNPRMQANSLLGMLRDEAGLIERATGRKGVGQSLADVLTPNQLNLLRAVASEADRTAAVASAGAGPGSATAQRLASQNILRQLIGPTGLPSSWAESAVANTVIGKPFNLIYGGVAEPRIQNALADALLDPTFAQKAVAAAQPRGPLLPNNALTQLLTQSARVTPAQLVTGER